MNKNIRFALSALALAAALSAIACGADAASPDASTAVPTEEWNVQKEYIPTATAQPATPSIEAPPTPAPTSTPDPQESPRVLWMRTSHAGAGVVTIRFATNVPTTAEVGVSQAEVGPAAIYTEQLKDLATVHETSVPANAMGRYVVHAKDAQGKDAWGTLRLSDQYGLDWGTQSTAPALKVMDAKHIAVSWGFASNHPSYMGLDAELFVFATSAKCTTADACVGERVADLDAPAGNGVKVETHTVTATIAGSANDYQLVIAQPLNQQSSSMIFFQMNVRGDQLPKNQVSGPGEIKSN